MNKEKIIDNEDFINDVKLLKFHDIITSDNDLSEKLERSKSNISEYLNNKISASKPFLKKFHDKYGDELRKIKALGSIPLPGKHYGNEQEGNLIPFYDDVATIGGKAGVAAATDGIAEPADYIDTGDWFRDATAAIRHYGESMDQYPTGCILALKEVKDRSLLIPGRDYCIETSEYRVTKRLQRGKDKEYITAYSTNQETYPDGRQVHEPFDIHLDSISRISLVLGYVVKKNGGTIVFSNNKK